MMGKIQNKLQNNFLHGDAYTVLCTLPDECIQCCITSPPYYGLRNYGIPGQIGLEDTPVEYIERLVEIFREVKRVLHASGTLWLNLGDVYAGSGDRRGGKGDEHGQGKKWSMPAKTIGLKPKDLMMLPARVALALQADGWYLRSDIIWEKPNAMPENIKDRPTCAHEHLFLLSKHPRYFYNADAIREPHTMKPQRRLLQRHSERDASMRNDRKYFYALREEPEIEKSILGRNKRNVWSIPTYPYKKAHFATFPPKLVEPCILAGSCAGDLILDPFMGAGTTALEAKKLERSFLGIELNPDYIQIAKQRLIDAGLGETTWQN